jgi:hypothetical protein
MAPDSKYEKGDIVDVNLKQNLTQRCMSQRCERPDAVDLRRSQNRKNLSVSGKRTVRDSKPSSITPSGSELSQ